MGFLNLLSKTSKLSNW